MSDLRRTRAIAAPGSPPPGAPAVMWSSRAHQAGERREAPLTTFEKGLGACFFALWRLIGLLMLPFLLIGPKTRRHVWGLPAPEPGWTWLHGASAGEHVAARALAPLIEPGAWRTATSLQTPVLGAFPAPFDLPFVVEDWLDRARPGRLVLVEAELWPGWLVGARARGIPVVVVNARLSQGTARWRAIPPLWRWLTAGVTFIGQDQTGDLKLAAELRAATFQLGRDAFIAASTRAGDEARVILAWRGVPVMIGRQPRPLLVIAPRHLDRVPEVVGLLEKSGLRYSLRSQGWHPDDEVLLLDTYGELSGLFAQARAAFIGGTFDESIGGHSPAEAFTAGVPVVHGPCTRSNPNAWTQGIALCVDGPDWSAEVICDRLSKAFRSALAVGPRPAPQNESAVRCASLLPASILPPETVARPLLEPLVGLVGAIGRRRPAFRGAPVRVSVPVVSVGALAAGGTGKTAVAGWLAAKVAGAFVVSRGYRRLGAGDDVRVGLPGEEPDRPLGDELEMLRRRGVPVISAPDRVAGAEEAIRQGARVIILDDGFQHRRLARDLDVVTIDARWPSARGLIPMGSGREPWQALGRADWIWLQSAPRGGTPPLPGPLPKVPVIRARYVPVGWLINGQRVGLSAVKGPVDVAAGVADPSGFLCALLKLGLEVRSFTDVGDHGPLVRISERCVVTEKDAARLPLDTDAMALLMDLEVEGGDVLLGAIQRLREPVW